MTGCTNATERAPASAEIQTFSELLRPGGDRRASFEMIGAKAFIPRA